MDAASSIPLDKADCPYIGLFAFDAAHERYFFGRDGDAELIAANVLSAGAMILHGPSGVGKSSVLGAALPKGLLKIAPGALMVMWRRWDCGFYVKLLQEAEQCRTTALAYYDALRRTSDDDVPGEEPPYVGVDEGSGSSRDQSPSTTAADAHPIADATTLSQPDSPPAPGLSDFSSASADLPPQSLEQLAEWWARDVGSP
ncbi:MAG TPA: hypothetical protein VES39_05590, partial [Rhodospirillales bacterium]|nr:hypothetical protein [Rhodospirillales bacterium]